MPDTAKQPLPSGPSNLCFNKEEFLKPDFNVDHFVVECRRRVPLETLKDDLAIYMKILQSAMIELINKDYADFVNLSTNLVGLDKAISNLTDPLNQFKEEVVNVQGTLNEAIENVREQMRKSARIRENKACMQRLMSIIQLVEKIEKLLGIQKADNPETVSYGGALTGKLIERVATEFNKLAFYVNKSRGLPLVEQVRPRISIITSTLQYSLEGFFREGLDEGNTEVLRQCLRTYATIDKMSDAEYLFRTHIVKPYMAKVICDQFLKTQGLKSMYGKIMEFIPKYCKKLKEVTSGTVQGSDIVRGYDFLVNAVWPEIVNSIEARTPSIFAPGNPKVFHEKYLCSMEFVERFERQCGSQASVKRLRAHSSYNDFQTKWSLPVYFQIRFQEIGGYFEMALSTPFNTTDDEGPFHLHATNSVWSCIKQCWTDDIYLSPLCHRFWKLSLHLLSRYATWIKEVHKQEVESRGKEKPTENNGHKGTGDTVNGTESTHVPITMGQLVALISDATKLSKKLPELYSEVISPRMKQLGLSDEAFLTDGIAESAEIVLSMLPPFGAHITQEIQTVCSVHLKLVNDIPRLYRRTNRDIPSKASVYVSNLVKPLKQFLEEHKTSLVEEHRVEWTLNILKSLTEQYLTVTNEVLISVKKMEESLKRLKKARGSSNNLAAMGMTDDDKIRKQLFLDIEEYGAQIESLGFTLDDVIGYKQLHELVDAACKPAAT